MDKSRDAKLTDGDANPGWTNDRANTMNSTWACSNTSRNEPVRDKPEAGTENSRRARLCSDGLKPQCANRSTNNDGPSCAKLRDESGGSNLLHPITDIPLNCSWTQSPWMDIARPTHVRPLTDGGNPNVTKSITNGTKPKWAKDCRNIEGPKCRRSNTGGPGPMRDKPSTKSKSPNFVKDLSDEDRSKSAAFRTKAADSSHAEQCSNVGKPGVEASNTERAGSSRAWLCIDIKEPVETQRGTESTGSGCAKLFAGDEKAKWPASNEEVSESDRHRARQDIEDPMHAKLRGNAERPR